MSEVIVSQEFVFLDVDVTSFDDVIRLVGDKYYKNNIVKEGYVDAVIEREKTYPTGLQTPLLNIAMPHTDSSHVIETAVSFVRTNKPISVKFMADPSVELSVNMFFVLALKNPDEQILLLRKLMSVFSNDETLKNLNISRDVNEAYDIIKSLK